MSEVKKYPLNPADFKSVSYSSIDLYLRCGEAFYRRYVLGLKEKPKISLLDGQAYHKTLADANFIIRDKAKLPKPKYYLDRYVGAVREETNQEKNPEVDWEGEDENSLYKKAKILLTDYATNHARKMRPEIIEERTEHAVNIDGVEFTINGVVDLVTKKSKDEQLSNRIIDYKTSTRPHSIEAARSSVQLSLYYAFKKNPRVGLITLVKSANPYVAVACAEKSPAQIAWAMQIAKRVFLSIKSGIFNLTNPNPQNWWCSERFCGYWKDCRGKYEKFI